MTINRDLFFDLWREHFGRVPASAIITLGLFIDYWEGRGGGDLRQLAYVMATAHGEVGVQLAPVREGFKETDAEARRHVAALRKAGKIKVNYAIADKTTGKSYYGRGYVQLTHKSNYETMGRWLGLDLVNDPDLALKPANAVKIIFVGMERGLFTGEKLGDYFTGASADPMHARRIVNRMDRAQKFADLWVIYVGVLREASRAVTPPAPPPEPAAPPPVPDLPDVHGDVDAPEPLPPTPTSAGGKAATIGAMLATAAAILSGGLAYAWDHIKEAVQWLLQ